MSTTAGTAAAAAASPPSSRPASAPPVAPAPTQKPEEGQSKKDGGDQEWTEEEYKSWEERWRNRVKEAAKTFYDAKAKAHFP